MARVDASPGAHAVEIDAGAIAIVAATASPVQPITFTALPPRFPNYGIWKADEATATFIKVVGVERSKGAIHNQKGPPY
jgi:hypothetical protein